jgi:putative ABC transport system permease protein
MSDSPMPRRRSGGSSMFLRMLLRSALVRRGRALAALLAVVVAAAVATAMMNLYVDAEAKLQHEFRNYGANVVVVANEGEPLPADVLDRISKTLGPDTLAVPFAYAVAHKADGTSVVVAGVDLDRVKRLNSWWSVSAWPSAQNQALVGVRAAAALASNGRPIDLSFEGHQRSLVPVGELSTGAAEDSRIYLSLADFTQWTGVTPSSVEILVPGSADEVTAAVQRLSTALPTAQVRPVRQIMEAEARVLGKTRSSLYASALLIILTAMLCVLATLTGWVLDRRRDFAIMKALGASERLVSGLFATEAAALGLIGAIIGFALGAAVAAWIGRANFHSAVVPRFSVLPAIILGSMAIATLSALLPISLLRRVQPAMILRGE